MLVGFLKNALLVLVSSILTLCALEGLLRLLVEPSRVYSSFHTVPALNEWKRKMRFWDQYHDRDKPLVGGHDPLLGWDFDIAQDRIRGSRLVPRAPQGDQLRIVAIGDSYTYGLDVEPHENYAARLDAWDGLEVLNMGVPGYGIDQAYLKYLEFGQEYSPDVVLFGIYVSDYERSSIGFTASAKPRIARRDETFEIVGQPVPAPQQQLESIDRQLAGRIYLVEAARNFWRKASIGEAERASFFAETDAVVTHMLQSLQRDLGAQRTLVVVHIPRAESFIEPEAFRDEMSRRLLAIYAELAITHIDLASEFVVAASPEAAFERFYVHRENGSAGHLSAAGHALVADLVVESLGGRFNQPTENKGGGR